ncbi:hypothetical protein E3T51_13400 [Cryobacterium serini]|uniref:Glycosyltransferase family 1 protein n=1 Tax=Cryobacterium serini TaxID=1259201 RepID=A0A4R9BK18_9MICO|nr:hypothetical protein [Cryobacterium serini]TFD86125.1 hypothetical protein E3T51_13400 [Cryobacterium serini]
MRTYKGIESLLRAFEETKDDRQSLRIVGRPDVQLKKTVWDAALRDQRISYRLQFVDDEVLVREIGEASLVVLPYLQMHNSGSLLLALSLGRHVLAPNTPVNASILIEVGARWMTLFDGDLKPEFIDQALTKAQAMLGIGLPVFNGRDWKTQGELHRKIYFQAMQVKVSHKPLTP